MPRLLSMEKWAVTRKALSGFLAKDHLPRVSRQSRLLANDKSNNEVIAGAVHRSPNICITTEINPGKFQLGDCR